MYVMISKQLHDELTLTLLRASLKGKYALTEVAERNGITLMQAMTLCLLEPHKGAPMNSMSHYLSCDPSSITGTVERLVSLQLILRKESETDRRSKLISLTEKGLQLRAELLEIVTAKRFPVLDTLSTEEVSEFIRLINKATGGASLSSPSK
jgi:DNA-binding MarR family transcriptional regulator